MSADFSRLNEVFGDEALKAHADRDGLTGLARAVFLARGGHAPAPLFGAPERCPSEPPQQEWERHMYYCCYGLPPEMLGFGDDPERCICGALRAGSRPETDPPAP